MPPAIPAAIARWLLFSAFVVVPAAVLLIAFGASVAVIYQLDENRLLIALGVLGMMLTHQLLEGVRWLSVGMPTGVIEMEAFETLANFLAAGAVYYLLAFAKGERRLAEELEESENRYSQLVENAPSPILVLRDGRIAYANPMAVGFFGEASLADLEGERLVEFVHSGDREMVREELDRVSESRFPIAIGPVRFAGDGARRATSTAAPIGYESEDAIQLVLQDITERQEYERQLNETFRSIEDAILIVDPDADEILECNDTACEMLGYDREELLDRGPSDIHPHEMDQFERFVGSVVNEESVRTDALSCTRRDGRQIPAEISASMVEFEGQDCLLAVVRDISDRKRRERRVKVLDRVLRHNIRNDMNVIRGYAEMVEATVEQERAAEMARSIRSTADDLVAISDEVREIQSTIDVDDVEQARIDAVGLVEGVVERYRNDYPDARITLDLPEELPVRANGNVAVAIEQVVENAIVHNDKAVPEVDIAARTAGVSEGWIELRIADNGPGMPKQERAILARGEEITPLQHGSGLGLWVATWIVEAFEGSVRFEDETPEGTAVVFELKRPAAPTEETSPAPDSAVS